MALIEIPTVNALTDKIIGAAIEVHRCLGPGLYESVYRACLVHELKALRLELQVDQKLPLIYKGLDLGRVFKIDMVVENTVIVELKAVSELAPIHRAQLVTYLKLTGLPAGLLINFNVPLLKNGLQRVLNTRL
jgi:GxxExxY protein